MGGGEARTNSGWTVGRPIGAWNGPGGGTCLYGTVAGGRAGPRRAGPAGGG